MLRYHRLAAVLIVALVLSVQGDPIFAQLRVANWNVTNFDDNDPRINDFKTAIYDTYNGRSMAPDILIGEEFISAGAVSDFLSLLNSATGSPGDWAAAPFIDGADTDSAFFYRTTKVDFLGVTVVAYGSSSTSNHPRNIQRYDVRLIGFDTPEATVAIYASHMKAGSGSEDEARRLIEAERIRDDAESLPAGWHFILGADLNIQRSSEAAYVELVGSQANNDGRFYDPIKTPGTWNNNYTYRFVHTQEPSSAMDDRHDQILLSASLIDGEGFDYDGNPNVSYSTTTWNDPNHSYRSWGNDGTTYNNPIATTSNSMVGPTIAQALINSVNNNGHLPVFLDLLTPDPVAGACCTPCGCVDSLTEAECLAEDGEFRGVGVICGEEVPACTFPSGMIFNEILISHEGTQDSEFVEIVGQPGDVLCGLSIVVIEGETLSKGLVKRIVPLDNCGGDTCMLDSNGYFVAGGVNGSIDADLVIGSGTNIFENGTETLILVRDTQLSILAPNNDVDSDNDGIADIDAEVLGTLIDAMGFIDDDYPGSDKIYFSAPFIGPDGTTVPAGATRCPNGVDTDTVEDWVLLSRDMAGADGGVPVTPGSATPPACGGDFDGDGDFDLMDYAGMQRCFGVYSAECSALEMDGQYGITLSDYELFADLLVGP